MQYGTVGDEADKAAVSLVKRIRVMAEFIQAHHREEFCREWWPDNWPGKAKGEDVLQFFSNPELEKIITMSRRVVIELWTSQCGDSPSMANGYGKPRG